MIAAGHEIVLIGFAKDIDATKIIQGKNFRQIWYPFVQMESGSVLQRLKTSLLRGPEWGSKSL